MGKSQSILNNFNSIKNERFNTSKARDYLRDARTITKEDQTTTLTSMVMYSFDNDPSYAEFRKTYVHKGNNAQEKAKECLTALKKELWETEQRLIVNMIIYAFENDPKYKQQKQ